MKVTVIREVQLSTTLTLEMEIPDSVIEAEKTTTHGPWPIRTFVEEAIKSNMEFNDTLFPKNLTPEWVMDDWFVTKGGIDEEVGVILPLTTDDELAHWDVG